MEFEEHEEEQDEEMVMAVAPPSYDSLGNSVSGGRPKMAGESASSARKSAGSGNIRYRECLKNHAVSIGGHAVDGCGEFLAAGEEGTLDGLKCAACNCHRNFHRKESEGEGAGAGLYQHPHQFSATYYRAAPPAGYLHLTPPAQHRPLALPAASGGGGGGGMTTSREEEDVSNPSSSGGGGGSGGSGMRRRFRTKFSQEQKEKLLGFAERVGWRIQKHDEAAVEQFCAETGVKRHVLKVWMHNNKHTLGKKP